MNKNQSRWNRQQLILAMSLYCKIPFGKLHYRNPDIVKMSKIIGRTPSALSMKLVNLASFDPTHKSRGICGLSNVGKEDKKIWDEFSSNWEKLVFESELAISELLSNKNDVELVENAFKAKEYSNSGKLVLTKVRLLQNFFRDAVLSSYNFSCAICGFNIQDFLNASHIIPWSKNEKLRADPRNGLSLCVLHDRAFDRGFITLNDDYTIIVSEGLLDAEIQPQYYNAALKINGMPIRTPDKFMPYLDSIKFHRNEIFKNRI